MFEHSVKPKNAGDHFEYKFVTNPISLFLNLIMIGPNGNAFLVLIIIGKSEETVLLNKNNLNFLMATLIWIYTIMNHLQLIQRMTDRRCFVIIFVDIKLESPRKC